MTEQSKPQALPVLASDGSKDGPTKKLSLPTLVLLGLGVSLLAVFLIGWYFTQQEWLNSCGQKCASWVIFPPLDQTQMFGVIRNAVTAAAALGLGVTIVLSYRRQRVAEETLVFTAETQRLSVEAQDLAQRRLEREGLDTLRGRYLDIAELLNRPSDFSNITALHALESLTTSWLQFDNRQEANASIALLMSSIRLSNATSSPHAREFRQTAARTVERHMRETEFPQLHWGSLDVDATGCIGAPGIRGWKISGGEKSASRKDSMPLDVSYVTMTNGTLRLTLRTRSTSEPLKSNMEALDMTGGRLSIGGSVPVGGLFRITFDSSDFHGGILSLNINHDNSQSVYEFDNCEFNGTAMLALPSRV